MRADSYALHTAGNARYAQEKNLTPTMPSSAHELSRLRHSDNRYMLEFGPYMRRWIDWQPGHIKINQGTPNTLVGTDGNDRMDAAGYARYLGPFAPHFDLTQLTHFHAGGGHDLFGGSARNDIVWGGTGNDTLLILVQESTDQTRVKEWYVGGPSGTKAGTTQSRQHATNDAQVLMAAGH